MSHLTAGRLEVETVPTLKGGYLREQPDIGLGQRKKPILTVQCSMKAMVKIRSFRHVRSVHDAGEPSLGENGDAITQPPGSPAPPTRR